MRTIVAIVAAGALAVHGGVSAAVFRVSAGNVSGNEDGTSWTTAFDGLQEAIDAAHDDGGGEVWVASGVYGGDAGGTVMKEHVHVYGGFAGTETSRDQRDWETNVAVIEGTANQCAMFGAANATLDGFTVRGVSAKDDDPAEPRGGMWNTHVDALAVANCTFSACKGGGMSNLYSSLTVMGCTFSANDGGGMNNFDSSPEVDACVFSGNQDSGMYNDQDSSPAVSNCVFSGNTAGTGGGGGMVSFASSPTLVNCTFHGNSAGAGGAIFIYDSSAVLTNCILWGDTPEEIVVFNGTLSVTYCDVQGGHAGGGNIDEDPLFADAASGDLRLRTDSPCLGAGNVGAAPATDITGRSRGAETDMGAYEGAVTIPGPLGCFGGALVTRPDKAGVLGAMLTAAAAVLVLARQRRLAIVREQW